MVVELDQIRNGQRGPKTVDFFSGKRSGYSAEIYDDESFKDRTDELTQRAIDLTIRSGLWSPEVSRRMIIGGMEKSVAERTSMIFFKMRGSVLEKYVGFSWQEIFHIHVIVEGAEGDVLVNYLKLRAFEPWHTRKHLGRTAIQLAVATNKADYLAHRTGSPAAARSFLESGVFMEKRRFPFDAMFDTDTLIQQILTGLHFRIRTCGKKGVDWSTGVSIADYLEPNRAYIPDETHIPTMEIKKWMEKDLGMDFKRGDSLIEIGQLK